MFCAEMVFLSGIGAHLIAALHRSTTWRYSDDDRGRRHPHRDRRRVVTRAPSGNWRPGRSTRCGPAATSRRATRAPRRWWVWPASRRTERADRHVVLCCRSIPGARRQEIADLDNATDGRDGPRRRRRRRVPPGVPRHPGADRGARPADRRDDPSDPAAVDRRGVTQTAGTTR